VGTREEETEDDAVKVELLLLFEDEALLV